MPVSPVRLWPSARKKCQTNTNTALSERKWLSGRASPCQGEGRGFESHLPLHFYCRSGGMVDAAVSKTVGAKTPCRFDSGLRHRDITPAKTSFPALAGIALSSPERPLVTQWSRVVQLRRRSIHLPLKAPSSATTTSPTTDEIGPDSKMGPPRLHYLFLSGKSMVVF